MSTLAYVVARMLLMILYIICYHEASMVKVKKVILPAKMVYTFELIHALSAIGNFNKKT